MSRRSPFWVLLVLVVVFSATGRQSEALEISQTSRSHLQEKAFALSLPEHRQPIRGGLLQDAKGHMHRQQLQRTNSRGPLEPEFFNDPPVGASGNPSEYLHPVDKHCHPRCSWTCSEPKCNSNCTSVCQAPMCMTACEKPRLSKCRQVCKDPHCAVVCPPGASTQCASGACPDCQVICGDPDCHIDCGQGRVCRSTCADPVCSWRCDKGTCPEPDCQLNCDTPKFCGLVTPKPTLQDVYAGNDVEALHGRRIPAAEYVGRELGWEGFAKVPSNRLVSGGLPPTGPLMAVAAQPSVGALPMQGALPLPTDPCADFCDKAPAPAPAPAPGPAPAPAPDQGPEPELGASPDCPCKHKEDGEMINNPRWVVVARTL